MYALGIFLYINYVRYNTYIYTPVEFCLNSLNNLLFYYY